MKKFFPGIMSVAVLCGFSLAQGPAAQDPVPQPDRTATQEQQTTPPAQVTPPTSAQPSGMQANSNVRVAPGSIIPVQLTKSIDAKKVKTGDQVEAKVTQDKEQKESQLGIAFDRAVMNGSDVAMPMSIQAIIAPPNANPNNNTASSGSQPSSPAGYGGNSGSSNQRPGGMSSGSTSTEAPNAPANSGQDPSDAQAAANARPQITGKTQGVVGIADLKLAMADNTAQGSVVSSEKNNVKLETGTMMLLKVNP